MKAGSNPEKIIGNRGRFNRKICVKLYSLLKADNDASLAEATIWSVYIIEQVIKAELNRVNPLLLYESTKTIEPGLAIKLASGLKDGRSKTIYLDHAFRLFIALHPELKNIVPNFTELQRLRNELIHGCFDFDTSRIKLKEVITDNLDTFKDAFVSNFGHTFVEKLTGDFTTSKRVLADEYLKELKLKLDEHHKKYTEFSKSTIRTLLKRAPELSGSDDIDINDTIRCPACTELGLDEILIFDHDWTPDGGRTDVTAYYQCRVCNLSLSSYEFSKLKSNPEITYVLNGDETWYKQEQIEEYLGL